MKTFLLAAGFGTRLHPMTDKIPKCLVPINGKPLLQIWLELCQKYGIDEVLINTHHLPHVIENYFKVNGYSFHEEANNLSTYRKKNFKVILSFEPILLGSAGTLFKNRHFVESEKEFFTLYADNLTNVDLSKLIKFHKSHGDLFTMGLFKTNRPTVCGIAELNGDGKIVSFEEKPKKPKTDLAAAGIYIASPAIFNFFRCGQREDFDKPLDLGFHIFPKLVGHMYGYQIREYLLDIGDMNCYHRAQKDWANIASLSQGEVP